MVWDFLQIIGRFVVPLMKNLLEKYSKDLQILNNLFQVWKNYVWSFNTFFSTIDVPFINS